METIEEIQARYKAIRQRLYPPKVVNRALEFRPKPEPVPQPKPLKEVEFPVLVHREIKTYKIFTYAILSQGGLEPRNVKWEQIVRHICIKYKITPTLLFCTRRHAKLAKARHEAWQLAHELTALSLPQMGRLSRRDHTSVLHGIRKPHDINALVSEFVQSING